MKVRRGAKSARWQDTVIDDPQTRKVQGALTAMGSLTDAMFEAGGMMGSELLSKPLGEVLEILGINGIRFHYEPSDKAKEMEAEGRKRIRRNQGQIPPLAEYDPVTLEVSLVVRYDPLDPRDDSIPLADRVDELKAHLNSALLEAVRKRPNRDYSDRSNRVITTIRVCEIDKVGSPDDPPEKS